MIDSYHVSLTDSGQRQQEGGCREAGGVKKLCGGWVAAVMAEETGNAGLAGESLDAAVETVLSFIEEYLPERWHTESMISLLQLSFHEAVKAVAEDCGISLTAVIYNGLYAVYGHAGGGGAVVRSVYDEYFILAKPRREELSGDTAQKTLCAGPEYWDFGSLGEEVCALLLMTDEVFSAAVRGGEAGEAEEIDVTYVRRFADRNLLKTLSAESLAGVEEKVRGYLAGEENARREGARAVAGLLNPGEMPEEHEDAEDAPGAIQEERAEKDGETREKNRYGLTVSKARGLKPADRTKLIEEPLFRKEKGMWRMLQSVGSREDFLCGAEDLIEIRIYDEDAPERPGEFWFDFWVYAGLSRYEFETFYEPGHADLQEEFLKIVNRLIDNGVLKFQEL